MDPEYRGYGYQDASVRLDAPLLPQALVYRLDRYGWWQASLALPSLHPGATTKGAVLYLADAYDVATRELVKIKILGTGEYR